MPATTSSCSFVRSFVLKKYRHGNPCHDILQRRVQYISKWHFLADMFLTDGAPELKDLPGKNIPFIALHSIVRLAPTKVGHVRLLFIGVKAYLHSPNSALRSSLLERGRSPCKIKCYFEVYPYYRSTCLVVALSNEPSLGHCATPIPFPRCYYVRQGHR